MYRYIVKRVLLVIPTLLGAAALVFVLMRLIPGDVCVVRLGSSGGTFDPKAVAVCHAELGMDRPVVLQFIDFIWGIVRLDFGTSMWSGNPVTTEIWARLPISLEVAILATVIAIAIAIPLGAVSAVKQDTWIDVLVRVFAVGGTATPSFWLGLMSLLVVLNVSGAIFGKPWMPPIEYVSIWEDPIRNLSMAFLPAVTVGYRYAAVSMRMTRSAMLEVMQEDYIRTARAKGLINKLIINRHALKNALLPVVTLIGIEFAFLIGGLVVTEQVFNLNGVGRLFVQAVQNQDYTLTQGLVMLTVMVFVISNLVVDLLYAWLDPRIRYTEAEPVMVTTARTTDGLGATRTWSAQRLLTLIVREPLGTFGFVLVFVMTATGLCAELIAPYSPTANDFGAMMEAPSWAHPLGTDQFGRDLLSRIIFGARTAMIVGLSSAFVGSAFGLVLGVASAYFGGKTDLVLQRIFDVLMAFPLIIMALAVVAIFGTGVQNVIIAITIPLIPRCARVVRSSALAIREIPYVDAARALGFGHFRIILRHMIPNVMAPFLIMLTAFVGQAILAEASLSYLGLGVQEPVPAWGLMLQGGAEEFATTAPWIAIFPGVAIVLSVLGINLFGDALRDALDPKLRKR